MTGHQFDLEFVQSFLNHPGKADPPGAESVFASHPSGKNEAIEVAYFFHHRFAFHYWAKWSQYNKNTITPNLVSVDWHNDVGGECDFDPDKITSYDFSNTEFSSLFAWAGLKPLNDGHISPAQYLGFVNDVFVLRKQDPDDQDCENQRHQVNTTFQGEEVHVRHYWSVEELVSALHEKSNRPVMFDIDLDYFVEDGESDDQNLVKESEIDAFIDPKSPLLDFVFKNLVGGMTIALEPHHCGGFHNCIFLLNKINRKWFSSNSGCYDWNHLLK